MERIITLIQTVLDWVQNKVTDKYGLFVIGFLFGSISPASYIFFQQHEIDRLQQLITEEKSSIEYYKSVAERWQEKAFENEKTHIQKTKEMLAFFEDLETYYQRKNESQEEINKNLGQYIMKLNTVVSQLNNENNDEKKD